MKAKNLSLYLLGSLSLFGIALPAYLLCRYVFNTYVQQEDWFIPTLLCFQIWILAGLVLTFLLGRQMIEILAKQAEREERRGKDEFYELFKAFEKLKASDNSPEQKSNEKEKQKMLKDLDEILTISQKNKDAKIEEFKSLYDWYKNTFNKS